MSLTERERLTQNYYNLSARQWFEKLGVKGKRGKDRPCFWAEEMAVFMTKLGGDKKVLEIGSGPATDGRYLGLMGADVLSFDYSRTMLTIAKEINPNGKYLLMDMQDLALPENSFDGFWATVCLLHLEDLDIALKEIVRVTKNNGIGFITVKEGDGKTVDPETGSFYRYYRHPNFVRKLARLGLRTKSNGRRSWTPNHDYLTYLVRVVK
jgi:ubiquinone/menaquinone biosynthesis C-methylase UbiE